MTNPLDNVQDGEPLSLVAGDTWTWQRSDLGADFPPAAYSLTYSMQREGNTTAPTTFTATESGETYTVTVPAATTAVLAAGTWQWTAHAIRTADSARVTVGSGIFTVKPNPAVAHDPRSHAAKVLAAIEALIEGRATSDVSSYSIAGRSLTKLSIDELMSWRAKYRAMVNREQAAASGRSTGRTHVVRFSS